MPIFDNFPYTNFHELNLDWIIKMLRQYADTLEYVQTFDVSGEVSKKLEQMLADGELTNLLGNFPARLTAVENVNTQQAGAIQTLQENSLSEHIFRSGTVNVSPTAPEPVEIANLEIVRQGWYIIDTYSNLSSEAHAGYDFSMYVSLWRNGARERYRACRGYDMRGGGGVNSTLIQWCEPGDVIRLAALQTYTAAVDIYGQIEVIRIPVHY